MTRNFLSCRLMKNLFHSSPQKTLSHSEYNSTLKQLCNNRKRGIEDKRKCDFMKCDLIYFQECELVPGWFAKSKQCTIPKARGNVGWSWKNDKHTWKKGNFFTIFQHSKIKVIKVGKSIPQKKKFKESSSLGFLLEIPYSTRLWK